MLTVIAARQWMRVLVFVFLCTRRMVTVIAARRLMRVLVFVCSGVLHQAHSHCDCFEAMRACGCLGVLVHKAHGHCACREAIRACSCLRILVHKAHGHCDCCEAMHVCACLCFSCAQGAWSLLLV
jgi:hypothetical protein